MKNKEFKCQVNPAIKEVSISNYRVPGGSTFSYDVKPDYVHIKSLIGNNSIYHNTSGYYCYVGEYIHIPIKRWQQMLKNNQIFILEGESQTYNIF